MKYLVFPKFFDENYCNKLIDDANKFISADTYIKIHGNRQSFSSSNLDLYLYNFVFYKNYKKP